LWWQREQIATARSRANHSNIHFGRPVQNGDLVITRYRRVAASLEGVPDVVQLLSRLALGLLFIDHGLQKYNGQGGVAAFEGFLRSLKNVPAPGPTSHIVPALEVVGGIALIAGLLTRVFALLLAGEMVVTGFYVKAHDLHQPLVSKLGAGVELDLVYLVLLVTVLFVGPGRASIDHLLRLEAVRSPKNDPTASRPSASLNPKERSVA
jgi:putative oxidoreductase